MPTSYISVRTALYGFAPGRDDGHGRLEVRAGQTLLLLDTSDHEWWKFKIKTNRQHNDGDSGLVPKMLTKEVRNAWSTGADYELIKRDFIARADGDLTIIEDESLSVYCVDGDWVLVKGTLGAGYVPKKCVELEQEINQTNDILQSQVPEPEEPDFPEEAASITPDHEEPHWWGGGDADSDHLINTMPQDQINISPRSNFGFGSTTAWYEPASQRSGMITSRSDASEVVALLAAHGCQDLTRALDYSSFSDFPVSGGGFGDVYQGRLLNGARIAVKAMRASTLSESPKHLKRAARELYTWSKLNHRNIVPLLGLAIFRDQIGMVSPWMMHGTLPQYLEKMPGVDRLDMCIQISEGLSYLHHCSIAHGSLKGANILVSDDGVPALADFGESSLRDHSLSFTQTGTGPSFAVRWTAPEMLEGSITQPSTASDVYALGMTIYETVTGAVPYHGKREHAAIYLVVVQKKHPERPKVMLNDKTSADELWNLLVMCWSPEPPVRPSVSDVLEALKRIQAISRLSRKMDATEIISHLVAHGWVDLSNRLNLASFSGPPASHDGLGDIYRGQLLDGATVAVKLHQISIDRNNLGSKNMQASLFTL